MTDEKSAEEACAAAGAVPEHQTVSIPTSNWWSPWVEAAKLKSCEVLEFVKKDLTEISTVVKSEASSVVNSTANVIKDTFKLEEPNSQANTVKKSVSSFLGTISSVLSPLPDDDDQEAILIHNDAPVALSKLQTKFYELIKNPDTFLKEIDESQEMQFSSWLSVSEDQLKITSVTKHLVSSPELHNQYETLVPEHVTHINFWKRYLFRRALVEDDEVRSDAKARREMRQAEQIQWEKEDFAQNIDISEEDQMKLLADYESETKGGKGKQGGGRKGEEEDLRVKLKKDLVMVGESNSSSHMSSSSADTEGKDTSDDWEKDFELDDAEDVVASDTK